MSDELERLAKKAVADDVHVSSMFNERNSLAREATLARGVLALLSERRELVAGLREALAVLREVDEAYGMKRHRLKALSTLASRIDPTGEKQ